METSSLKVRVAAALPALGLVLVAANWWRQPAALPAWGAAAAVFVVMLIALRWSQLAARRARGDAAALRGPASVSTAVVFGGLIMVIPLTTTLAKAYGLVDSAGSGQRATMIITGAYLALMGNAMPKLLPPLASMQCGGARVQAFHRFMGWTWVLCGLGMSLAWAVLPPAAASPVSMAIVVSAMAITVVQLLRVRGLRPAKEA